MGGWRGRRDRPKKGPGKSQDFPGPFELRLLALAAGGERLHPPPIEAVEGVWRIRAAALEERLIGIGCLSGAEGAAKGKPVPGFSR